jgi:hypothetical protein
LIYLNYKDRETVEKQLNEMNKRKRSNLTKATARSPQDKLILTWSSLINYRNDIAHAEMRFNSADVTKLQKYVKNELIQSLENLFPEFTA